MTTLAKLDTIGVDALRDVGDARRKALGAFGIRTVFDLVTHYPRRYIDRTRESAIADLTEDEPASVLARVERIGSRRVKGNRVVVTATVRDRSGTLDVTFFNQAWRERQLSPGTEAVFFGTMSRFRGRAQLTNPIVDLVGDRTGRVLPVYPQSDKVRLTSDVVSRLVAEALRRARDLDDPVPDVFLDRHDLLDRTNAFHDIHLPDSEEAHEAAARRLVFDELLRVQLALVLRKRHLEATEAGVAHLDRSPMVARFHESLSFPLTGAQQRTIAEIARDMARPVPMHRLLQGDVGAGKTLVAVSALLAAVDGGHQGVLMAPTEVLAEQHALGVRNLLDGFSVGDDASLFGQRPVRVELLTNRVPAARRRAVTAGAAAGEVDIVIGTHALLSADVAFASLGLAVIDEQHRFGVEQRAALRDKGGQETVPDVLVMTATPIPRTAAMTVYGDLDVSVLDELPPGRTPITTVWARREADVDAMWAGVRDQLDEGRQAYVVCPLVEGSEKLEVASASETFEDLGAGHLAGYRLGLLHGRVAAEEKEATMAAFRAGDLDVLVATTVIEVGVDVPNATAMVILDADRFGIAQLHQLRGRVGRGSWASTCWLVGGDGEDGNPRIEALVATTDGFALAEVDLDLRGEGSIMGERQKGRSDLKLASLRRHRQEVDDARRAAFEIVDDLGLSDDLRAELGLFLDEDDVEFLLKG